MKYVKQMSTCSAHRIYVLGTPSSYNLTEQVPRDYYQWVCATVILGGHPANCLTPVPSVAATLPYLSPCISLSHCLKKATIPYLIVSEYRQKNLWCLLLPFIRLEKYYSYNVCRVHGFSEADYDRRLPNLRQFNHIVYNICFPNECAFILTVRYNQIIAGIGPMKITKISYSKTSEN